MGRFAECKTITELNEARNKVLAEINKEYQERRKAILSEIPEYKRVPVIRLVEIPEPESTPFVSFPIISDIKVEANEIQFTGQGQVAY